jgi:hypothetical protein
MKVALVFSLKIAVCLVALALAGALTQPTLRAQHAHSIVSISICSEVDPSSTSSDCPGGPTQDTALPVLSPITGSVSINTDNYGGLTTLADEHSSIFPPGALPFTKGYTFFVATRTNLNSISSGVTVLTSPGPASNGQWTLSFAPGYGLYDPANPVGSRNGQVFVSPFEHNLCPSATSIQGQDPTFDLNYADPGSVVLDPTNPFDLGAGNLLMIYEGTNRCIGLLGGDNVKQGNSFYSTIAVATSFDFGHTWPAYRFDLNPWGFLNNPLPNQDSSVGPEQAFGAYANNVCAGNNCLLTQVFPDPAYGRYAVLYPQVTVQDVLDSSVTQKKKALTDHMGDAVPAAFVDDVGWSLQRPLYLYELHNYAPGSPDLNDPPLLTNPTSDLMIARAQLNGGTAPLSFEKWDGKTFSQDGAGGDEAPIFPSGPFANCEDPSQDRAMGSISYVPATQQYLLTFVCMSQNGNPANENGVAGAAWFFSTSYDLSNPGEWTTPQEIVGTWRPYVNQNGQSCNSFNGWYPSFMSLGQKPGYLTTTGYVFYMQGCSDGDTPGGRQYSTRTFTITTN